MSDIVNGLIKSAIFGAIMSLIGCYKGFYATGRARKAWAGPPPKPWSWPRVLILMGDYVMTAIMF